MTVETEQIEAEATTLSTEAASFAVKTADDYEAAGEFLKGIKKYQKGVKETFGPHVSRAHEAHKELLADQKKHLAPAIKAEAIVKTKMLAWRREEEKRAAEERRKAEAEAKRVAEEQQIAEAAAAEKAGEAERAERIITQERAPMPVPQRQAAPKVAGVSIRKSWNFEITNPDDIPREYLIVDEKKIRGVVKAMKGDTRIPGVNVFEEEGIAAG